MNSIFLYFQDFPQTNSITLVSDRRAPLDITYYVYDIMALDIYNVNQLLVTETNY